MPFNSPGPKDTAGPLRYTENYVYNVADCLGKGATASVYLGRQRAHGTQVAIKVFTFPESPHITQARLRETELLTAVSHRNVMKILAAECEFNTGHNVLVMPYCQCGSVYSLLEQPQNGFGFEEKEFLSFLHDITQGLQYLNQKRIVHRDIKPGNIMKGIEDDGRSVYILTDFGAARELDHGEETFMSIYGTEEYIHPGMFQRAVLRQAGQTKFDSSVDLWSLAVTIYHVATGKLPFQSYGGRNDSQMTFQIISERKSGEISGIQREPGGHVERSRQLPETCYLSRGLRRLLEPILAGLFESDAKRAMSFDQYFEAVNDLINRTTLKIFVVPNGTNMTVYLRKTDSFIHIQETIAALTDIPPARQILLLGHSELKETVEINVQLQMFPKAVRNEQLFLFEKDNYDNNKMIPDPLPPFPPMFPGSSVKTDASVARASAAVACFIEWKTTQAIHVQELLLEAKINLRLFVEHTVRPVERIIPELEKHLAVTRKLSDCLQLSRQTVASLMKLLDAFGVFRDNERETKTVVKEFTDSDDCVQDLLNQTRNRYEEINVYTSVLVQKLKECSTPGPTDHLGCNHDDHCLTKIGHIRQGIQTVSTTFGKHKKYGDLHPHEEFIHKVEREKLENLCGKIIPLFQGHCEPNLKVVHNAVNKQNSLVLKHLTRIGKVETNIKCVTDCQAQINDKLNKIGERYQTVSKFLQSHLKANLVNQSTVSRTTPMKTEDTAEEMHSSSSSVREEKATLMKQLLNEIHELGTARAELDGMLSSNTESLMELKRMLENTSRLSPASFASERMSVECTDRAYPGLASCFSIT